MDISREKAAGSGGASIRLRYSRQFQNSGHAHNIDAEIELPVGASPETREQIIRELEMGVEQLARQIVQRNARPTEGSRSQPSFPGRSVTSEPAANRSVPAPHLQGEPASRTTTPGIRTPISDSMPNNPTGGSEGKTIRLPDFINVIKKHLNLTPQEAMRLLNVDTLEGQNYREAFSKLQEIIKHNAEGPTTRMPARDRPQQTTDNDQPRQTDRAPSSNRQPLNHHAPTSTQTQGQTALRTVTAPLSDEEEKTHLSEAATVIEFPATPKGPVPIQFGVVRDNIVAPPPYKFDEEDENFAEEDEEEDFELPGEAPATHLSAQRKLDELKEVRGNNPASNERLIVLTNLVDEQISEEALQKIIQAAWGANTRKKLKAPQLEKLISWAKEDFFIEEAEAIVNMLAAREE